MDNDGKFCGMEGSNIADCMVEEDKTSIKLDMEHDWLIRKKEMRKVLILL